jgi:threonine dehydratase
LTLAHLTENLDKHRPGPDNKQLDLTLWSTVRHLPAPANAPDARLGLFTRAHFEAPAAAVRRCPEYRPTPLHSLPELAAEWGVAGLYLKDERQRLGLRSFKALGGAWAVMEAVRAQATKAGGPTPPPGSLPGRDYPVPEGLAPPSHLLVQAGVGGLPGGLAAWKTAYWGREQPRLVVVESARADGLMESIRRGQLTAGGDANTAMTGMDCSQPSPLALNILAKLADDFIAAEDEEAQAAQRRLARLPTALATSITGAAGLAPLPAAASNPDLAEALGLNRNSVVMAVITEAAV